MKRFVLTLPESKIKLNINKTDVKYFLKRYGIITLLGIFTAAGAIYGAVSSNKADQAMLEAFDFLLVTNFKLRVDQTLFMTFAASLTSYFLFYFALILSSFSAWGMAVVPLITFLKGYGAGLCGGYLVLTYGVEGMGFYVLMILPGAFLSALAIIAQGKESIGFSKSIAKTLFFKNSEASIDNPMQTVKFLTSSSYLLFAICFSALVDMLTAMLFSEVFVL